MRLVVSTGKLPSSSAVLIGLGEQEQVQLYVRTSMYWHAAPLMGEYSHLLKRFDAVTVPLLAAVQPRDWRRLLFLSEFTQEKAPGPGMILVQELAPLSVASAGEYFAAMGRRAVVALWADPLDRHTLYNTVVAGLESGVKELWLVYVYGSPPILGDLEIGSSPAAYFYLKRFFPRMVDRVNYRLEEGLVFRDHLQNHRVIHGRGREIDLLRLAFGDSVQLAKDVLEDMLENGGAVALKSLLDFTREDKEYMGIFERLVDYGYLRLAGVPPQVVITEKGLYALRK